MLVIAASLFLNMLEKWTDARIAERKPFGKPAMKKSKNTLNIKKKRINIFYKEKAFRTGHRNAFFCIEPYLLAFLYGVGQINSKLQKRS